MNTKPIKQLFKIIGGKPAPKGDNAFDKDGTPFVKMKDLGRAHFSNNLIQIEQKVSEKVAKENRLKLVKRGSILLPRSGSVALNHRAVLGVDAYMVSHICALEVIDDKEINNTYAYYYLRSIKMDRISKKTTGLDAITFEDLGKISIPLPSLYDQVRIAHLLDKVEGLIAQRKQHLQQLDDLLKSVFLDMFGDPVRNEKGWDVELLGNLAKIERGRFSPRPRNDPKFFNGDYPFIQTGDINRANGRLSDYTQTLNELGTKVSKEFGAGTIVIAIVGATIGETAILQLPVYAPDSVIGITYKSENKEESVFIEFLLRFWKPVLKARAPEAARANINIETLRPIPVIWPNEPDRERFTAIVEKVEALKCRYQQSLNDLESLYGALSQQAFKGELDLSRVPLPDVQEDVEKAAPFEQAQISEAEDVVINLPDTDYLLEALTDSSLRERLLADWLKSYCQQIGNTAFSTDNFLAAAQTRIAELHPDSEFELDASDFEIVKNWVFEALANGTLVQRFNDENNRIDLNSRPRNWGEWS